MTYENRRSGQTSSTIHKKLARWVECATVEVMNRHDNQAPPSGRPQGKRIGDVARETGIAAHVLRHWEDEGILKPARDSLGHRRYRPEDLSRATAVRRAQEAGFTLEQIRRFIRATAQERKALLNDQPVGALQTSAIGSLAPSVYGRRRHAHISQPLLPIQRVKGKPVKKVRTPHDGAIKPSATLGAT